MPGPVSLYPGSTPSFPWRNGPGILSGAPGKGCWVGCSCRTFREEKNKQSNQNRQGVRPLAGGRRLHLSQYACLLKRVGEGVEQYNRKNRNNRATKRKREKEKKIRKKRESESQDKKTKREQQREKKKEKNIKHVVGHASQLACGGRPPAAESASPAGQGTWESGAAGGKGPSWRQQHLVPRQVSIPVFFSNKRKNPIQKKAVT